MEENVDCQDESIPEASGEKTVLSKNQLKKQQRLQRWAETKKERRKKEKEKIKERKRKMFEEIRKQGLDEQSLVVKKKKMSDPEASNIRVAVDCAYDSLMTESDVKKLIKQIQRCYAENRKANKPLQFYVSSLKDKTKQILDDVIDGYQNWDIHFKEEEPREAFGAENIVYLAAESPNVLQDLDPDKVYIIGGLVDHNHHKGYCYEKVLEQGWSHAQLPIGDFVKLNSRKVLAVNHVYEIILAYVQLGSWKDAFFQVLPNRKVKEYIKEENAPSEGNRLCDSPTASRVSTREGDTSTTNEKDSVVAAVGVSTHEGDMSTTNEKDSVVAAVGVDEASSNKRDLSPSEDSVVSADKQNMSASKEDVVVAATEEEIDTVAARTGEGTVDVDESQENQDLLRDRVGLEANAIYTETKNSVEQSAARKIHSELDLETKPELVREHGDEGKDES